MRMRLGILHDAAAQERMHAREAAEQAAAAAKKRIDAEKPTVRTEAEQAKFESDLNKVEDSKEKVKEEKKKPKIRPLTDTRAIELGANFASETFIFLVAAGLLVFERWWSKRKETAKDEHVVERLKALEEQTERVGYLEREISRLRGQEVSEPPPKEKEGDAAVTKESEKQAQVVTAP
ncbi:hypothetical protein ANO11243_001320 [Dothideomycetidae sp. 11243]|nr:hypothetical protein ANO11243_001320 [fungal sp. No.11243]